MRSEMQSPSRHRARWAYKHIHSERNTSQRETSRPSRQWFGMPRTRWWLSDSALEPEGWPGRSSLQFTQQFTVFSDPPSLSASWRTDQGSPRDRNIYRWSGTIYWMFMLVSTQLL